MIKTGIFGQDHMSALKKAVGVYARRHRVTAQNIANVDTPGYRSQKVKFEELLDRNKMSIKGAMTNPRHMALGTQDLMDTEEQVVNRDTDFDNGVNNVDIDNEMTSLATTDLSYRMATRLLSMRYSMLSSAIKGRVI